jgi:hypothetical protein
MKIGFLTLFAAVVLAACAPSAEPEPATPGISAPASTPADEQAALAALAEINKAQADYFVRSRRYAITYDELIETLFLNQLRTAPP